MWLRLPEVWSLAVPREDPRVFSLKTDMSGVYVVLVSLQRTVESSEVGPQSFQWLDYYICEFGGFGLHLFRE